MRLRETQLQDGQQTNNFTVYKQLKNTTNTSNSYLGADYSGLEGITPEDIATNINSDQTIGDKPNTQGVFVSNGKIDVGGTPVITTQGQITYLGSYSGNNSIPIGMISSNLFASTILGQRD